MEVKACILAAMLFSSTILALPVDLTYKPDLEIMDDESMVAAEELMENGALREKRSYGGYGDSSVCFQVDNGYGGPVTICRDQALNGAGHFGPFESSAGYGGSNSFGYGPGFGITPYGSGFHSPAQHASYPGTFNAFSKPHSSPHYRSDLLQLADRITEEAIQTLGGARSAYEPYGFQGYDHGSYGLQGYSGRPNVGVHSKGLGNAAVPLLFSCQPNLIQGKLIPANFATQGHETSFNYRNKVAEHDMDDNDRLSPHKKTQEQGNRIEGVHRNSQEEVNRKEVEIKLKDGDKKAKEEVNSKEAATKLNEDTAKKLGSE